MSGKDVSNAALRRHGRRIGLGGVPNFPVMTRTKSHTGIKRRPSGRHVPKPPGSR